MGCNSSTIDAAARRRTKPNNGNNKNNGSNTQANRPDPSSNLGFYFDAILNGCHTIAAPSNMMPVVCLARESFPIITSFLHLEDSTPTDIQLPIIAASCVGNGRVICFSQVQFLTPKCLHVADTAKVMNNSIQWISEGQSSMTPIYAMGFDRSLQPIVQRSCQDLGFFVEAGSFRPSYSNYKALIIPSDIDLSDSKNFSDIIEYVTNGGGLAVFYNHSDMGSMAMPINKLLFKFNLAFTYCFLNEDLDSADNIGVPPSYNYVRDHNFIPLSMKFKATVRQNQVDTSALDDLVTTLRYYIMVCDEGHDDQLIDISESSWEFLRKTNYSTDQGICPELTHGIVAVLLIDLYTKLPLDHIHAIPEAKFLPGLTGDVTLGEFEIERDIQNETWISTGLWLPAGTIGTIESAEPLPDVHVQIGSHHESLVTKQAPWKRWPLTVSVSPLSETVTRVASPFGGIVYIAVNNMAQEIQKHVVLKFKNFCHHPTADYRDPSIWEATKDIQAPWGEIVANNVIFTLPSDTMRSIQDFSTIFKKFEIIVEELSKYMSYDVDRPYRFVFDIELPDEQPSCGYPLVFQLEDVSGILCEFHKPSNQLFTAVTLMAIVSIRENCFDDVTETAIATIATSVIFRKIFDGFDPFDFAGYMLPTLFHELWEIHTNFDENLIPTTLKKFQDPSFQVSDVPDDMWISFVREMCRIGKRDFTKLLERSRPIPLNISISLQGLPVYQAGNPK